MGKGKELPAVDFHAVLSRRNPELAERMAREGVSPVEEPPAGAPVLTVVPEPAPESASQPAAPVRAAPSEPTTRTRGHRRGLVPRAEGREAGRITVYVPAELALRLRTYCFQRDLTMTDVAGEVLVAALEQKLASR